MESSSSPKRRRITAEDGEDKGRARALAHVQQPKARLKDVPKKYRDDKEIVLAAIERYTLNIFDASPRLRNDVQVILAATKKNFATWGAATPEFKADALKVSRVVEISGKALKYAAESLKSDHRVVSIAVKQNGRALQYASEALRADRDIVKIAIYQCSDALGYASAALRDDRELVLLAVKRTYRPPVESYPDRATMYRRSLRFLSFFSELYGPLKFASDRLRDDRDFVLEAVKQDGRALRCASKRLCEDRELVEIALKQDGDALWNTKTSLNNDPEIVGIALASKCSCFVLQGMGKALKKRMVSLIHRLVALGIRKTAFSVQKQGQVWGSNVMAYAEQWKRNTYEKLWLMKKILPSCDVLEKKILEYIGSIHDEIKTANEMIQVAPVLCGLLDVANDFPGIARATR